MLIYVTISTNLGTYTPAALSWAGGAYSASCLARLLDWCLPGLDQIKP